MSTLTLATLLPGADVEIGHHHTVTLPVLGSINIDTIISTLVAMTIVLGFGLYVARRATAGMPSKPQLLWEMVVGTVEEQVEDSVGPTAPYVVPLAVSLFFFILTANWLELIPTKHYLPAPSADVNFTFALALSVTFWAMGAGIRRKGLGHYLKGMTKPYPALTPINVIEQVAKPLSLSLRLFGNVFAGGIMLTVMALLPATILWFPQAAWRLFDMAIGLVQAFIFALLTILYFGFELGEGH